MSDDPKIVKTIIPTTCPHCNKDIFIGYQIGIPMLTSILRLDDIIEAKAEVKKKLEEINFENKEEKDNIIKWLDDEQTLIGKSDIEEILQQIILEHKQNDNK